MKPGILVRVEESHTFPGKFELYSLPPFHGRNMTYPLVTGVGIVLEIKCFDVYGTSVHILTPRGHGWTYIDGVEVIR